MKRLSRILILLLFAAPLAWGQASTLTGGGGLVSAGAGAPAGSCATAALYTNSSNGDFYACNGGVWLKVSGGAGSPAFSAVTAGTNTAALVMGTGGSLTTSGSGTITATTVPVNGLTAATATNTTANGNFPQIINFALTTDSTSGVTAGETSAALNGSVTAGLANQSVFKAVTLAGSLATPLSVVQGAMSGAVAIPAMQVSQGANTGTTAFPLALFQTTWNNGSLVGRGLGISIIQTANAGASWPFYINTGVSGTTNVVNIDTAGNINTVSSLITPLITLSSGATGIRTAASNVPLLIVGGVDTANAGAGQTTLTLRGSNNSSATGTAASSVSISGGGMTGAVTNTAGADVSISGGLGTGTSTPSHVIIKAPSFGAASGTTAQTGVTRYVQHAKAGSTTTATATNIFQVPVAVNQTVAIRVHVHVETTQATPQNCSSSGDFYLNVQNTGGTVTTNVSAIIGSSTICSTGTLTIAAAASGATPSVISITPSWTTIVPTAVIITAAIESLSQQDVALL